VSVQELCLGSVSSCHFYVCWYVLWCLFGHCLTFITVAEIPWSREFFSCEVFPPRSLWSKQPTWRPNINTETHHQAQFWTSQDTSVTMARPLPEIWNLDLLDTKQECCSRYRDVWSFSVTHRSFWTGFPISILYKLLVGCPSLLANLGVQLHSLYGILSSFAALRRHRAMMTRDPHSIFKIMLLYPIINAYTKSCIFMLMFPVIKITDHCSLCMFRELRRK
jgi:hypothetical protein